MRCERMWLVCSNGRVLVSVVCPACSGMLDVTGCHFLHTVSAQVSTISALNTAFLDRIRKKLMIFFFQIKYLVMK